MGQLLYTCLVMMIRKKMILITILWCLSNLCSSQIYVPTSWFRRLQTPLAEPVPEPEPVVRSISIPGYRIYRIPLAEPEQQKIKRVLRRIVGTQKLPVSVTDNSFIRHSSIVTPATMATSSTAVPPSLTATSSSTASSSSTEISTGLDTITSEEHLFDEIFTDVSEQPSWSIDTARFHIIPAVPSRTTARAVRVPKEVFEKEKHDIVEKETIPAEFSPVPANPMMINGVKQLYHILVNEDDKHYNILGM